MPGTTRDHIEVPLSIAGVPILLTDTAGLRATEDAVEAIGVARATALAEAADVLVWLGEADVAPDHPRLIRVHAQADRRERRLAPEGAIAVSSLTGEGLSALLEDVAIRVTNLLPTEGAIPLNRRQAALVEEAAHALELANGAGDLVIFAESLRLARSAFDRLTGRAGVEDVLDALFSRFCLGK
jgi:tRNA modification GTPase